MQGVCKTTVSTCSSQYERMAQYSEDGSFCYCNICDGVEDFTLICAPCTHMNTFDFTLNRWFWFTLHILVLVCAVNVVDQKKSLIFNCFNLKKEKKN